MAIDPSIPLQVQPLRLGEIFAQAQQNRQDQDYRQFQMDTAREEMDLKRGQIEREQEKEKWSAIGEAAQWADTPEKWDKAVDYLVRRHPELAEYKGQFSPEARMAAIAQAGQMAEYLKAQKDDEYTLGEGQVRYRGDQVIGRGPDKPQEYLVIPEGGKAVPKGAMGGAAPPSPTSLSGIWQSLIKQESGGRPGVTGPETPYGRAQGLTQMLPATAQAMAQKTGLPWQPQMMSDTSPEGAAYQEQLGRAYFEEGLQKYGGDVRKALMYYHGGPNEALWGPKTRAYADQVLARAGQGGQAGDPAGTLYGNPKKREAPSGFEWGADGSLTPTKGGPSDPSRLSERIKVESDLREKFNGLPETKKFQELRSAFQQIRALGANPNATAADDLGLIFSFMRTLDPTSTVREGEFANAQNAAGVPDRVRNYYNQVLDGNRLNPKQRKEFVGTAAKLYLTQRELYNNRAGEYRSYAKEYGVKPDNVAKMFRPQSQIDRATGRAPKPKGAKSGWSIQRVD